MPAVRRGLCDLAVQLLVRFAPARMCRAGAGAAKLTAGARVRSVHMCDPATETCSPAYAQQCCTGGVCTTATDVCNVGALLCVWRWAVGGGRCTRADAVLSHDRGYRGSQGVWVDNQEMDIELPTSDAAQRAFNPDYINFQNMRFSTYTALASTHAAKCGVVTPCSEQEYQFAGVIPQNNGAYHTVSPSAC